MVSDFTTQSSFSFQMAEGEYEIRGVVRDSHMMIAYSDWISLSASAALNSETWISSTFDTKLTSLKNTANVGELSLIAVQGLPYLDSSVPL